MTSPRQILEERPKSEFKHVAYIEEYHPGGHTEVLGAEPPGLHLVDAAHAEKLREALRAALDLLDESKNVLQNFNSRRPSIDARIVYDSEAVSILAKIDKLMGGERE